jgi:ParB family transcriptional regulator, chromosome partitioning protein
MVTTLINGSRLFGEIEKIRIADIHLPSNNLRTSNRLNIEKIASSIKQHGLLHPIVVRPKLHYFEIVAGYRRFLACKSLLWKEIPCHVINLDEMQTFEIALVENIRRKSFTPLEEANAFKMYVSDHGWGSIAELSKKLGKSPSSIVRRIALLDLPDDVLEDIKKLELSPSTAEELLPIKDPIKQSHLAKLIARRHLTTIKARNLVKNETIHDNKNDNSRIRNQVQAFDKSIVVLKIALNKIAAIKEEEKEKNIFIHELLLYQRNILNDQIDVLIKSKSKYLRMLRYRNIV